MKKMIFLIGIVLINIACYAQKPVIDKEILKSWEKVDNGSISNDGNFVSYKIRKLWHFGNQETLFIRSVKSSREIKLESNSGFSEQFSEDSKRLYFHKNDSLGIVDLKSLQVKYISGISSFQLFDHGKLERLLVRAVDKDRLSICDELGNSIFSRNNVKKFWLTSDGSTIYFSSSIDHEQSGQQGLFVANLISTKTKEIYKGKELSNLVLSPHGDQIAFTNNDHDESIWRYDNRANKLESYSLGGNKDVEPNKRIAGLVALSYDGKRLFLNLKKQPVQVNDDLVKVGIWHYRDFYLQSVQQQEGDQNSLVSLNWQDKKIIQMGGEDDQISISFGKPNDNSGLIKKIYTNFVDGNLNPLNLWEGFKLNTFTGQRSRLPLDARNPSLSPSGKYILGSNNSLIDLLIYDQSSQKVFNITKAIRFSNGKATDSIAMSKGELRLLGWLNDDLKVLVFDKYDIWLCDPLGKVKPVCITQGIGRASRITFRISPLGKEERRIFNIGDKLILNAFNHDTKENGFFELKLGVTGSFKKLIMGPYVVEVPHNLSIPQLPIVKARDADVYLLCRSDAATSPNYFCTKDFKAFQPISTVFPEKKVQWKRSKLITWKDKRGNFLKGVLHYPENLDTTKKYPLIMNYYEEKSDELNAFQDPGFTYGLVNIPWFVSNGYLVFTPDIKFRTGYVGESALESVESAADYLKHLAYVDQYKIGLQGYSFSGYTTNYIVTHSNRFAAAVSGAGVSNYMSFYNTVIEFGGGSGQRTMEDLQHQMKCTIWDNQELYIKNSPVLYADKVSTPLLLVHNENDGIVDYRQSTEMYLALRRFGKRCWMLQYDNEGHLTINPKNSEDFTIRMMHFFDHYLKDKPAPTWMTKGIPAKEKGTRLGLEYDTQMRTPEPGVVEK